MIRSAIISTCGKFRYKLVRLNHEAARPLVFIMLNPSTADGDVDDPTIRKCLGFSNRLGYEGIIVYNLYAYRATDPKELKRAGYPVGPANGDFLTEAVKYAKVQNVPIVCAWGANARGLEYARQIREWLRLIDAPTYSLKLLDDGTPSHPLMLPYSSRLIRL